MTDYTAEAPDWWNTNGAKVQELISRRLDDPILVLFAGRTRVQPADQPCGLARGWVSRPIARGVGAEATLQVEPLREFRMQVVIPGEDVFSKVDGSAPTAALGRIDDCVVRLHGEVRSYLLNRLGVAHGSSAFADIPKVVEQITSDRAAEPLATVASIVTTCARLADQLKTLAKADGELKDVNVQRLSGELVRGVANSAVLVLALEDAPKVNIVELPPAVLAASTHGLSGYLRVRLAADLAGAKAFGYTWPKP